MHKHWTLQQFAEHYRETLNRQPNAHGQHLSPIFGPSHNIMRVARENYPELDVDRAFTEAVKRKA